MEERSLSTEHLYSNTYSYVMPLQKHKVETKLECFTLCLNTFGCLYVNLKKEDGMIDCHTASLLHGIQYYETPNSTVGWDYYYVKYNY